MHLGAAARYTGRTLFHLLFLNSLKTMLFLDDILWEDGDDDDAAGGGDAAGAGGDEDEEEDDDEEV